MHFCCQISCQLVYKWIVGRWSCKNPLNVWAIPIWNGLKLIPPSDGILNAQIANTSSKPIQIKDMLENRSIVRKTFRSFTMLNINFSAINNFFNVEEFSWYSSVVSSSCFSFNWFISMDSYLFLPLIFFNFTVSFRKKYPRINPIKLIRSATKQGRRYGNFPH